MQGKIRSTGPVWLLAACASCVHAQEATELACEDDRAMVHGTGNRQYIVGHCPWVTVGGSDNVLTLDSADRLTVGGESNTVRYRGLGGGEPHVSVGGTDNEIVRVAGNDATDAVPERSADARTDAGADAVAAAPAGDDAPTSAAAGDGLEDLEAVVHQSYMVLSGDFENARDHAWALYADGTALRTPRIAFIDIDKRLSRERWPQGWFEWRRSDGRIEVRASGGGGFAPLKGRVEPVRPAAKGLRLSGDYTFVRTFGSMMMGNAGSVRNTYSFTPDGRYTISNSSFVGSGMTVGPGQVVVAAQCDAAGSRRQIATGDPVVPGGSMRGDGCGSANAGRYHVDGYAITLAADDGTTRRVGFYPIWEGDLMIDNAWYWRRGG